MSIELLWFLYVICFDVVPFHMHLYESGAWIMMLQCILSFCAAAAKKRAWKSVHVLWIWIKELQNLTRTAICSCLLEILLQRITGSKEANKTWSDSHQISVHAVHTATSSRTTQPAGVQWMPFRFSGLFIQVSVLQPFYACCSCRPDENVSTSW